MKYGVGLFPTEPLPKMIRLAKLSEKLGFSHIWIGDSHLIWREAYVNMAATALNTFRVKIGTGVTNPLTRHPSVVASAYATLEELAPRRFTVGIGLGDSSVETMGMKPARLEYFEKTIQQMRALLAGEEVELETGKIHLKHSCKKKIPIYIAASGPKMLELSGRIADGIIVLVGIADEYLRQAKERIEAGERPRDRILLEFESHLLDFDICVVGHHELQIGAKRQLELSIRLEVRQAHGRLEFHAPLRNRKMITEIGRRRKEGAMLGTKSGNTK